jgi:hypothetical protein
MDKVELKFSEIKPFGLGLEPLNPPGEPYALLLWSFVILAAVLCHTHHVRSGAGHLCRVQRARVTPPLS